MTGGYFYKCKLAKPSAAAQNDADAKRLWDVYGGDDGLGRLGDHRAPVLPA